jgi:hypothetical protein
LGQNSFNHHLDPLRIRREGTGKPPLQSAESHQIEEKEKDEDKKKETGTETDTGIKVNGQTLWRDSNGNRYYYVNGDTKSPFISVEQKDGSFKWSTKEAMLNPPKPGSYGEIGMIEHNGNLSTMYQLPNGSRAFSDGESWLQANKGDTSFTRTEQISMRDQYGNTLKQEPRVGHTEPWRTGGGGSQGEMFPNRGTIGGGGAGGYNVDSAVNEFINSPGSSQGRDTQTIGQMRQFLETLPPEGLDRFMGDAAKAAHDYNYYQGNGQLCIGCGMATVFDEGNLDVSRYK